MMHRLEKAILIVTASCTLLANTAGAVDHMLGLVPSDGVGMFVKAFTVQAGTNITGVEFANNDPATVFPRVVLVRGPASSLSEGTAVASVTNVQESTGGVVTVTLSSPVSVSEAGTYYVGVRIPEGEGKQSAGHGAAVGANSVSEPNGSYVAGGSAGVLVPLRADLVISLTTATGSGYSKAGLLPEEGAGQPARTFLQARRVGPSEITIAFGLAQSMKATSLRIFDASGRVVRELGHGAARAGAYQRSWDGRDDRGAAVASGVFFVRLQADRTTLKHKFVFAH